MEKTDFLPLGSIVIIKGGVKKTMIVARGLATKINDEMQFFDYGGCLYPEGLMGDQMLFFNHTDIMKVVFTGYTDDDNALMLENLDAWLQNPQFKRGDPAQLNKKNGVPPPEEK